jgi:hypothetical protein
MPRLLALVIVLPAGYFLRFTPGLPEWLRDASGGALYVVCLALGLGVLWPRGRPVMLAVAAFALTCGVEFAQLAHPAWLDALRATRPGRLALGTTFAWGDFPPYAAGAVLGCGLLGRTAKSTAEGKYPSSS